MQTKNEKELFAIGKTVGVRIRGQKPRSKNQKAMILALSGELGSGKTNFVRGLGRGLGIKGSITSPTFVLAKRYRIPKSEISGQRPNFQWFWHLDVYRLKNTQDLVGLDFESIINNQHNIVAIEWADKIKKVIPKTAYWIRFSHLSRNRRKIMSPRNFLRDRI